MSCFSGNIYNNKNRCAHNPSASSGNFQKHLDTVFPRKQPHEYYPVEIPFHARDGSRSVKSTPTTPVYEAIQEEVDRCPELAPEALLQSADAQAWHQLYTWHPALAGESLEGPPLLVALYIDGIRFTRSATQ